MRDARRAIAAKLTSQDGAECVAKCARLHEATKGAHVMNDHVESNFGTYDYLARIFRNASAENISGIVQQRRNGDFEQPLNVASDRRKRKHDAPEPSRGGFFWTGLTDELRASLVSAVRKERESASSAGRTALAEHDEAKLERREERVITLLNAAVDHYARAKELFTAWYGAKDAEGKWVTQAAKDAVAVDRALTGTSEAEQLEYLRLQIEMRTLGLGWDQFATKWSSSKDVRIGTVAHLRKLLVEEILPEEMALRRKKQLPTEAAPPQYAATDLGQLGTADADAMAIQSTGPGRSSRRRSWKRRRQPLSSGARRPASQTRSSSCSRRMRRPSTKSSSASSSRYCGSTSTRTQGSQCSSGRRAASSVSPMDSQTCVVRAARSCFRQVWCYGSGTQTLNLGRWRGSAGWRCCRRSGSDSRSIAGATIRASSQPMPPPRHPTSAVAMLIVWTSEKNACECSVLVLCGCIYACARCLCDSPHPCDPAHVLVAIQAAQL